MNEVTRILSAIEQGDPSATEQLLPHVYEELRLLAARKLAQEKPGQTLQATALVHEAYLRLVGQSSEHAWDHRGHFFAAAAEAMRRILIENARKKSTTKHGGQRHRLDLDLAQPVAPESADDLLALDEVLEKFTQLDPNKAQLVKLRFYAGLTMPQIAAIMEISLATAERYWLFARTWLYVELEGAEE